MNTYVAVNVVVEQLIFIQLFGRGGQDMLAFICVYLTDCARLKDIGAGTIHNTLGWQNIGWKRLRKRWLICTA